MQANEIAQKFANGAECQKWLTARQASWLFLQFQAENRNYVKSYRYNWARGHFISGDDTYLWTATEGRGGSAIFNAEKYVAPVQRQDPLKDWLSAKGYDFQELFQHDMAKLMSLTVEFGAERTTLSA